MIMHRRAIAIADQLMQTIEAAGRTMPTVPQLTCSKHWPGRLETCCPRPAHVLDMLPLDDRGTSPKADILLAARKLTLSLGQQPRQHDHYVLSPLVKQCSQHSLLSHCGLASAGPLVQQQKRGYSSSIAPAAMQRLAGIKARHDELCKQLSGDAKTGSGDSHTACC